MSIAASPWASAAVLASGTHHDVVRGAAVAQAGLQRNRTISVPSRSCCGWTDSSSPSPIQFPTLGARRARVGYLQSIYSASNSWSNASSPRLCGNSCRFTARRCTQALPATLTGDKTITPTSAAQIPASMKGFSFSTRKIAKKRAVAPASRSSAPSYDDRVTCVVGVGAMGTFQLIRRNVIDWSGRA